MVPGSIAAARPSRYEDDRVRQRNTRRRARNRHGNANLLVGRPEAPFAVVPAVLRNHEETAVHPDAGREPRRAGRGIEEPGVPAPFACSAGGMPVPSRSRISRLVRRTDAPMKLRTSEFMSFPSARNAPLDGPQKSKSDTTRRSQRRNCTRAECLHTELSPGSATLVDGDVLEVREGASHQRAGMRLIVDPRSSGDRGQPIELPA